IPAGAPVRLDLRLAGRNIDIGGLAQSLGIRERIRGTASLDLTVIGSLPMPAISGTAAVENAVFDGIDFNLAQITLESRGRATVITELTAQRGSTSVTGSGVIQANGEIAVNFAAYNLNLNMLDNVVYPYITLSGPAALSGRIGGTLRKPVVQAELSSSDPVVNRRPLDSLSGSIIWDGTRLTVRDASAVEGDASIRIPSMVFNPAVRYADGSVEIRNLPVGTVIAMLRNSPVLGRPEGQGLLRFLQTLPSPFSGTLNANLAVSGPIASAKAQGTISAAGVSMGAATLERAQLAFNTSGDRLNITDATLAGPGINLSASMQIKAGKIDGLTANLADTTVPALVSVMRNIPGLSLIPFGRRLQDFAAGLPAPAAGLI
ncbi:MAG TPA: hypothetical protein DCL60_10490, partial [Armatimonadetes bacterium]|nr:hypothetical protein [Armatimonadota bacterium]